MVVLISKRAMFSPLVFSQIENFVAHGLGAAEIAARVGCKLGTLRVKCSQHGISLRRWNPSAATPKRNLPKRMVISLPENVALDLQKEAVKTVVSQADLAVALLDAIARDHLYDAVIDRDIEPRKPKASRAPRRPKAGPK
jgi:hypothetical protein